MGGGGLHSTTGTRAVCGLGSADAGCTAAGQTVRRTPLLLQRDEVESLAQSTLDATPVQQRTMTSAPTLDEMLVSGTDANAFLSSLFIQEEQPQIVSPIGFSLDEEHSGGGGGGGKGGHRRTEQEFKRETNLCTLQ